MTECPKCKGYGIVGSAVPDILRGRGAIFSSNECDMCHGSGEVPMTNEEWLKSMNTEQLAEWIVHIADQCTISHECNRCESWCDEKRVVEWLKQPHREE